MATQLPPQTEIVRDGQGNLRRLSHARSPYVPHGFVPASPTSLANWYLQTFGSHFGVDPLWLADEPPASGRSYDVRARHRLQLADVKRLRDMTLVTYVQSYAGLPVFLAGFSVKMRSDSSSVISSQSTLHLDIEIDHEHLERYGQESPKLAATQLKKLLGLGRKEATPNIESTRLVIYRYLADARLDPTLNEDGQPASSPELRLPNVPRKIESGQHYMVLETLFSLELPDWGLLEWRALIEVETSAVLYLRAFVESCTAAIFRDDPITISGDAAASPCAALAVLDPLREFVNLEGLTSADPQALRGEYVELIDSDPPVMAPPTSPLGSCDFTFPADSDDFAAVNAYHHMDALYRMVDEMGFSNYFADTLFPIPMDHRGENGAVNAHHHGSGTSTTKYRFGLAQTGCPVGIACDRRVVIHEFGHSVLRNRIASGTLSFAHGVGDSMAVILSDPRSFAPDRFDTFPFNTINRRHDREVAAGWGWGGVNDTGSYSSTQIMSTTLFRVYRSLGGDSGSLNEQEFAARFVTYLILAAVESETSATQPNGPEEFAQDVIDADLATTTFDGHPGGAFHKVIRWAFEKQDAFGGHPPDIDIYIDDGRGGEYPWLNDFTSPPGVWIRREPDGGTVHQAPLEGTPAYVYVRVGNRGSQAVSGVGVRAFIGPLGGDAIWPDDFTPLPVPELSVPGSIGPGGSLVVGPFEWTPQTTKGASIFMSASTPHDTSNGDTVIGSLPTRRLAPYDNNIAQRDVTVERYPVQYSVKFVCGASCGGPVAPGSYFTAINVHNPTDKPVRFRKKVAVALPGERPGHVSTFTFNTLGPDEALEIDCADIYNRAGLSECCFLKGFVVIQSLVELDVVGVYSAAGADKMLETLDIEYLKPRIFEREPPDPIPQPCLPDLIPLPAFPPPPPNRPGQLPQNFCLSTVGGGRADAIRIIVRNKSDCDAPRSVTQVVFGNNPPIQVPTPQIPAGGQQFVEVMIPSGCYQGEGSCKFEITVNATSAFDEADVTNNTTSGSCPGVVS